MKTLRSLWPFVVLALLVANWLAGCRQTELVPFPALPDSSRVESQFSPATRRAMEGVYQFAEPNALGTQAVLKWSYVVEQGDTTYHLSMFCENEATFFVLEGYRVGQSIEFDGYWRRLTNADTGPARFTIANNEGARLLLSGTPSNARNVPITLRGQYRLRTTDRELVLRYVRPLNPRPFAVLAHRAGGRTSDLLPASENSLGMILLAPRLGATGVEIDVRFTRDGIPILYHDNTLNLRLLQKNGLEGGVEKYTFAQLSAVVRLLDGQRIPTLEEALNTILNDTPLTFVWLDAKDIKDMNAVRVLQQRIVQQAAARGRTLDVVIGLPGQEQVDQFEALEGHRGTPSLVELDTATVRRLNAGIWAPRFTLGLQNEQAQAMQAEGRRVFTWTLDDAVFIRQFITEGRFNGILSNYAPVVAYYHYSQP